MKERPIPFTAEMGQAAHLDLKTQTRRVVKASANGLTFDLTHAQRDNSDAMLEEPLGDYLHVPFYCDADGAPEGWPDKYDTHHRLSCPYGVPGDRLWVREPYYQQGHWRKVEGVLTRGGAQKWEFVPESDAIQFEPPTAFRKARKRGFENQVRWHKRLARFMPRTYSRTLLEVTGIRVERLQDASKLDLVAEGWPDQVEGRNAESIEMVRAGLDEANIDDGVVEWFAGLWEQINGEGSWEANYWVWVVQFERIER